MPRRKCWRKSDSKRTDWRAGKYNTESPERMPANVSPERKQARSPERMPTKSPGRKQAQSPERMPAQSPERNQAQSTERMPAQSQKQSVYHSKLYKAVDMQKLRSN